MQRCRPGQQITRSGETIADYTLVVVPGVMLGEAVRAVVVVAVAPPALRSTPPREGRLMANGTVKWFSEEKGYGFITPADGGRHLSVHHSSLEGRGFTS